MEHSFRTKSSGWQVTSSFTSWFTGSGHLCISVNLSGNLKSCNRTLISFNFSKNYTYFQDRSSGRALISKNFQMHHKMLQDGSPCVLVLRTEQHTIYLHEMKQITNSQLGQLNSQTIKGLMKRNSL